MIVTQDDIGEGRHLVMPLDLDLSIEGFRAHLRNEHARTRAERLKPSEWLTCCGADSERGVIFSLQCHLDDRGRIILETDGGPDGNVKTYETKTGFRVVDAKTGQELARSPQ